MHVIKPSKKMRYAAWALGLTVGGVAALTYRSQKRFEFDGKVVLITGGSRGLGLVLARRLVAEGAIVAICARDMDELERAGDDLRDRGGKVIEIVCDVRKKEDCEHAVRVCVAQFRRLDVLINNAGVIQAGPLEAQTEDDFRDAMDTHFWGPFHMTHAALEHLKKSPGARIINISSIGGKIAVPHLAPYCASKFALAGLSAAWRVELAKDDVTVTTVCPGLMRTGSHINAEFKGQKEKEYALFSIMDASRLSSISADAAARQILSASKRGDAEALISVQAKLAATLHAGFPEASAAILAAVNNFLPNGNGTTDKLTGLESTSKFSPSFLTANIDAEANRNNELEPDESIDNNSLPIT